MKITIEKAEKMTVIIEFDGKEFKKEYNDPKELYCNMLEMLPILLEN